MNKMFALTALGIFVAGCTTPAQMAGNKPSLSLVTTSPVNQVAYCVSKALDNQGSRFNLLQAPDGSEARITVAAPRPPLALAHIEETLAVYNISGGKLTLHFNSSILGNYKVGFKKIALNCV